MIHELLPQSVACDSVRGFDPLARLLNEEAAELKCAVESRIQEFTMGRTCARRALAKLGMQPTSILRGPKREPLWPPGVVGSISHCQGYCAAAVAIKGNVLTLGIDAEVHDALPVEVLEQIALDQEKDWLRLAPRGIHWDRLLFSAKESVFKAWFPLTHGWLGFEEAVITFEPSAGTFRARLTKMPSASQNRIPSGFSGRFLVRDGLVITAVVLHGQTVPSHSG